jgi:predicted MFS family arabinose efflux permease
LGISFEQAGLLVAARHCVGLTGAFWGFLGERKGYAWGMVIGLSALFLGSLTVSVSRTFSLALVGFVLIGLSKPVYDPNVQAFASGRIPYSKRARALGILESSWAGSWLVGIPLSGLLIAHFGWHSPFVLISGAALVAIICTKSLQEVAQTNPKNTGSASRVVSSTGEEVTVRAKPVLILGVSLLMVFANENMVIVYGAWLEKQFNLQVQTLGLYSILVGLAELGGEFTVVFLVDRFGKKRAIFTGLILTGLSYLALVHYSIDFSLRLRIGSFGTRQVVGIQLQCIGGGSNGRCTLRALAVATERGSLHPGSFFATCPGVSGYSAAAQR